MGVIAGFVHSPPQVSVSCLLSTDSFHVFHCKEESSILYSLFFDYLNAMTLAIDTHIFYRWRKLINKKARHIVPLILETPLRDIGCSKPNRSI